MAETEGERARRLVEGVLGLEQEEVAAALHGAQSTVSNWYKMERLPSAARRRLASLTADPERARAWLAEGAGVTMPPTITKRAVSLRSPDEGHPLPNLTRVIARLELALEDLREMAGGVPALTVEEAGHAVDGAGGESRPAGKRRRRAGP